MAVASRKSFLSNLERSGIVDRDKLNAALATLNQDPASPTATLEEIQNHLIQLGLVTEWHCTKLSAGKYKGFFLGKYKLIRHLGSGGMSTVYLAENKITGQRRAIKVLPRKKVDDKSFLDRFYREARAAAALNHPNIVRVYDIASVDKTHYMVMEYVEGIDLYAMVKRDGPQSFESALDNIRQSATGLKHAHQRNLIHRDIKPANLLLTDTGTIKILDLGLALLTADEEESLTIMHNERVMGTADYLSPEQAVNSHEVDQRTDIYSLGCTLYFLLTGQPPFPSGTLAQRIAMHQTQEPQTVETIRQDCPSEIAQFCRRMMQKKPEDRLPDTSIIISEIDGYLKNGQFPNTGISRGQFDFDIPEPITAPAINTIVVTEEPAKAGRSTNKPSTNRPIRTTEATIATATDSNNDGSAKSIPRKKTAIGLSLSLVSLSLLVIAILVFAILRFQNQTSAPTTEAESDIWQDNASDQKSPLAGPPPKLVKPSQKPSQKLSQKPSQKLNDKRDDKPNSPNTSQSTLGNGGKLSGNRPDQQKADPGQSGKTTAKSISFESEHFRRQDKNSWEIKYDKKPFGVIYPHKQAKVISGGVKPGEFVLHLYGNKDNVRFLPRGQFKSLKSIEFKIKLKDNKTNFTLRLDTKSDKEKTWKTKFEYPDKGKPSLSTTVFTEIKIEDFGTIDVHKFRFRLTGADSDGVLIDNLKVGLAR